MTAVFYLQDKLILCTLPTHIS